MQMISRFKKVRNPMLDKLFQRKNKIEHEIFCIECADRLRPEEKEQIKVLRLELLNVRFQIEKIVAPQV